MFLKIYYEYSRPCDARSIGFLAVDGCSGVFNGLCRGLDFGVFGERSLFYSILRLQIYDSVWSGLPTLFLDVVDGAKNLE